MKFPLCASCDWHNYSGNSLQAMSDSLYDLLGVANTATADQLRKAYKRAAVKAHPDKQGGSEEQFMRVKEAFELLKEPRLRKLYDARGLQAALAARQEQQAMAEARRRVKPPEVLCELEVDLEDLYCGRTKQVRLPKYTPCTTCNGNAGQIQLCVLCNGRGFVSNRACRQCQGHGRHYALCATCNGQGASVEHELVSVPVPAGARDGESIRLEGRGMRLAELESAGDMMVILRERQHADLRRVPQSQDLFLERTVSLAEALHGLNLPFTHLDGRRLMLTFQGVVQPEQVLRLRGQGMPPLLGASQGDLLVRVHVELPKEPSAELLAALPLAAASGEYC
jgi:DnaJ-class molecular chaperone